MFVIKSKTTADKMQFVSTSMTQPGLCPDLRTLIADARAGRPVPQTSATYDKPNIGYYISPERLKGATIPKLQEIQRNLADIIQEKRAAADASATTVESQPGVAAPELS